MNFGDPNFLAIELLIEVAIHSRRLYVWLRKIDFGFFSLVFAREFHWRWISGSIGKTDQNKK